MKDAPHRSPKKPRLSWKLHKRRLQLQLLTNFGKELPASDELYEQHEQRFLALLQKLLDIRKSLENYRTKALPEYCAACATLGADVWCVVSVDAVGKGADAEKFRHAMCAINEAKEMKNHFFNADEVLAGALRFLEIHINAMKSVKSQIEHRKRVKLDFDCYERKVAKLERKAMTSNQLERNRVKLQQAKDALQTVTFDLYRVYAKYESERDTMLNGELEMVRQVMHGFYAKNAEATNFQIKEEVHQPAVDARTEQIFKQMVAHELELDKSRVATPTDTQIVCAVASSTTGDPPSVLPSAVAPPPPPIVAAAIAVTSTECNPSDPPLSISTDDPSDILQLRMQALQPHESADDELSEKLRTIQLSRPKIPPARGLKLKPTNNQSEGQISR